MSCWMDTARGPRRSERRPDFRLLLVSHSPVWIKAVHDATQALGVTDAQACGAGDAVARLAGTAEHYSHLLVDSDDADGLLGALADLVAESTPPDTDMLVLGTVDSQFPGFRSVESATSGSIVDALQASTTRPKAMMEPSELRAVMSGATIETRYQPIVRVADRRPVGLEALVRLNHPLKGKIRPDCFVPQVEQAGLGAELTSLVCARAFSDLSGPFLAGLQLRISVNFPLDVLLMPAALERLEEQRAASDLAADQIIVELTESQPVEDVPGLRRALERLRKLGYGAAIDDVGPAVPRLERLLELPFSSLKLDRNLVRQAVNSAEVCVSIANTIAIAKAQGITVTAEGVETEATWNQMAALGVDEVQGFLVARPLPVAAVPVWLEAWTGNGGADA
jgi:EAL domain-containing protein (putative c-di-GMP-specific phosphodiesterase class I)